MEQNIENLRQIVIEALTNAVNFVADTITRQFHNPEAEGGEQGQEGDINAGFELFAEEDFNQQDEDPEQHEQMDFQNLDNDEEVNSVEWQFRIRCECGKLHILFSQV